MIVVGGGNSAGQATVFLADHVGQIHLVVRERHLAENMSRYLADRIERDERIEVLLHTQVRELLGKCSLEGVVVEDLDAGERRTLQAREMFVFIGASPCTDWVADTLALDSGGYVLTGVDAARAVGNGSFKALGRAPLLLETSPEHIRGGRDGKSCDCPFDSTPHHRQVVGSSPTAPSAPTATVSSTSGAIESCGTVDPV